MLGFKTLPGGQCEGWEEPGDREEAAVEQGQKGPAGPVFSGKEVRRPEANSEVNVFHRIPLASPLLESVEPGAPEGGL